MFYFHQFPAYFIPANLVAIPVSFLAIYSGVAVLATSFVQVISNFFGIITNYLLFALNTSVGFIEKLPYSVLHITSIFAKETILIYLFIISIFILFSIKRKNLIYSTLGLLLLLSLSFSLTETIRLRQQKIIFYSTGKQSAIGFINGKQQTLIADSILINDKKANKFQLDGAKSLYGITKVNAIAIDTVFDLHQQLPKELHPLYSLGNNFMFLNKRVAVVEIMPIPAGNCARLKVDYLVIRHNPKIIISNLLKLYEPGLIIFDGSNSIYKTDKWLAECKKAGLKACSLKDSGAYIVDL
jgi:competence protein ComEC